MGYFIDLFYVYVFVFCLFTYSYNVNEELPGQTNFNPNSDDQLPYKRASRWNEIKNTLLSLFILIMAPVIAILLTVFVFQSYQVDGPSMETTLHNNDRLIVWKLPRTVSKITSNQYVPNRGDIIIFSEPGLGNFNEPDGSKQLVKRVIALPGERVVVKDGIVTVFNNEHPEGFEPDTTLPYGQETTIPFSSSEREEYVVGDTQLFVCGDNRTNSLDSRSFGPIETHQVVGKLVARIFPLGQAEIF